MVRMRTTLSEQIVQIDAGGTSVEGALTVPSSARGVVLFAHGCGSSRHSPRNILVAHSLNTEGFATLLMDLLTRTEDSRPERRFDIDLLTSRLIVATRWLREQRATRDLTIGYFGASTGAAAALQAAVEVGPEVTAIVSRGGRPDLARGLDRVTTPTLFLVGERDEVVLHLNQGAYRQLASEKALVVIPGATHLFEEPDALEAVARHAAGWFGRHLAHGEAREHAERAVVLL